MLDTTIESNKETTVLNFQVLEYLGVGGTEVIGSFKNAWYLGMLLTWDTFDVLIQLRKLQIYRNLGSYKSTPPDRILYKNWDVHYRIWNGISILLSTPALPLVKNEL